jgi:hypothetical protein
MDEITLVGNNLALLVAASELARMGRPVRLFTDGKPMGAHFAGMQVQGYGFDIGMVMLEQCQLAHAQDDLGQYRPEVRNDWTRFGHLAAHWLQAQGPLRRVPTCECLMGGRIEPDHLIANRLDRFARAPLPGPDPLASTDARHPRHKTNSAAYDTLSYADAAQFCHGAPWHQAAIEPFVRKLLGRGSDSFLARYHRAAWVPLFYPETLRQALQGQPTSLAEYPFWTTAGGFVGGLVASLQAGLESQASVQLDVAPLQHLGIVGRQLVVRTTSGVQQSSSRAGLGLASERCYTLLGLPAQAPQAAASVVVAFCLVKASAIGRSTGCLMVVDEDLAAYRLTDQDMLAGLDTPQHRVTIEASPERLSALHPDMLPQDALALELARLLQVQDPAAVQVLRCITARNALVLPTAAAVQAADDGQALLEHAMPGIARTGSLLGYGVASFNDQIVQGLKLAQEFA